jgi:hypothetical protein
MFSSKQQVWIVISALLLLSIPGVAAQTVGATLTGTIADETQAVLPGVEISVTNLDNGARRTTISGDSGQYTVSDLAPGNYELEAQLPGFQTFVQSGINLSVGRNATLNVTLSIGAVSERVVVTGDAPLVDTLSSTLRGLVDERTIQDLPLNGRSYDQLARLQAGVVAYYGQGDPSGTGMTGSGQRMSVGGARPNQNNFLMDGTNITGVSGATPGSAAGGVNLGVEAIREFEVLTSSFDATYGRNSGAVISVVTKSGTNQIHGSIFEYHRNSALDAKNFFDDTDSDIPAFKRNQFGFSVGGPVMKDKIFLFGNYEGYRERIASTSTATVPTANGRLGIGVGPGGTDLPVNPGVVQYMNLYPLPNSTDFGNGTGRFLNAPGRIIDDDYFVIRYDHIVSDSDSYFVRYTCSCAGLRTSPSSTNTFNSFTESRRQYVTIEEKHIFSPAALNTFRVGFNRTYDASTDEQADSSLELVPGTNSFALNFSAQVAGGSASLTNIGPGGFGFQAWNSYQFGDDFHYTKGRHSIRVGGSWDHIRHNFTNATFYGGRYNFNDFPSFVAGISRSFEAYGIGSNVFRSMRANLVNLYIQDDFKMRPNFTLNLGFRFEWQDEPSEKNGFESRLQDPINDASVVAGTFFDRPGQVFHPRIGLAWDVTGDGKTSLRAGAGMFNDVLVGSFWVNSAVNAQPFNAVSTIDDPPPAIFPDAFGQIGPGVGVDSIIRNTPDAKLPTRTQWNLTLQQELFPDTVLTVAYSGAVGRNHVRTAEANHAVPTGTLNGVPVWCTDPGAGCVSGADPDSERQNDNFGFILTHMTDANTTYHSLQSSIRKRYSAGLQFLAAYTWGHSMDEGSQQWGSEGRNTPQNTALIFDHGFDRGDSIFDVRHSFSFNGIYELPFGQGQQYGSNMSGVANQILGGWEINSIVVLSGGNPFTVITGFNRSDNFDRRNTDRPNIIAGADLNPTEGTSIGCTGGPDAGTPLGTPDNWFDPCVFELPLQGTFGNVGRATARGQGVIQIDLGLSKRFVVTEAVGMQFRAEFFNIINRANFAHPSASTLKSDGDYRGNSGSIGRTVTTSRQIQFALKITF